MMNWRQAGALFVGLLVSSFVGFMLGYLVGVAR
jgi:hypothetical protein